MKKWPPTISKTQRENIGHSWKELTKILRGSEMGRPTKLTRSLVDRIAQVIRSGATRREAATLVGIGYSSLKSYLKEGRTGKGLKADLCFAVRLADTEYKAGLREMIHKAGERGEWRAAYHLLRHREGHEVEQREGRLKVRRLQIENRRLLAEIEHRELVNDSLRAIREKDGTVNDFLRESVEIQAVEASNEQRAAYWEGKHPIPSLAEDEEAAAAENAAEVE